MLAFALGMMLLAAPAPQVEADSAAPAVEAATPSTTAAEAQADPSRPVCRRGAQANSRFTTKVCKTAEEWEQRAETARQAFGEVQDRPVVSIAKGN